MIGYFVGMAAQSNAAGVLAKKEQVAQTGCRREIPKRWLWRFWDEGELEKTIRMHAGRGARMAGAQRLSGGGAFVHPRCCGCLDSKRHTNACHVFRPSSRINRRTLTCSNPACTRGRRCTAWGVPSLTTDSRPCTECSSRSGACLAARIRPITDVILRMVLGNRAAGHS